MSTEAVQLQFPSSSSAKSDVIVIYPFTYDSDSERAEDDNISNLWVDSECDYQWSRQGSPMNSEENSQCSSPRVEEPPRKRIRLNFHDINSDSSDDDSESGDETSETSCSSSESDDADEAVFNEDYISDGQIEDQHAGSVRTNGSEDIEEEEIIDVLTVEAPKVEVVHLQQDVNLDVEAYVTIPKEMINDPLMLSDKIQEFEEIRMDNKTVLDDEELERRENIISFLISVYQRRIEVLLTKQIGNDNSGINCC